MRAEFINPFLEATVEVLKTMAFVEPVAGKPYLKKDNVARGDISGVIGLTGDARGSLALSFSEASILEIVRNMLGEEINDLNGDIKDAVGELTNMISGVARKKLEASGYSIIGAIPTVVSGKNHSIRHVLGGPSIIIPFETSAGTFVVDVCLNA
ncbi:MAG: chemotaxis protein CheX [Syntrophales bacterium]|nr:chemotaxis protein CheX [Syntrophales bacterium]